MTNAPPSSRRTNRAGRPTGASSEDTRQGVLEVALSQFARFGYASTTITGIAREAGLTAPAVYYHFDSKEVLYEAVFNNTAPAVWEHLGAAASGATTMIGGVEAMVDTALGNQIPLDSNRFMAAMPTVAQLHPEFGHLLDQRLQLQNAVFARLAELGIKTGEFRGLDIDTATAFLRMTVMGAFLENYHQRNSSPISFEPLLTGLRALGDSSQL